MKESAQIYIDQRGPGLRALLVAEGRPLATASAPGRLDAQGLQQLISSLVTRGGRKPERAHLLIDSDQVRHNTFRLQEMPRADVEKIVARNLTASTGEREPVFRLTPLAPLQDKDVFLAEQISRETISRTLQFFADSGLRLASITTGLQAILAAFAAHRDDVLQAQAIFDISADAVTATFLSPTELLHHETVAIPESDRDDALEDQDRTLRRRLFTILNVIHGIYSQYMLANPHSPVEKAWLCGPEAAITGLEDSLIDAMDVEVAHLDPLQGEMEEGCAYAPLIGLAGTARASEQINFIPAEVLKPRRIANPRVLGYAAGGAILLLLATAFVSSRVDLTGRERALERDRAELLRLQVEAEALRGHTEALRALARLADEAPPLQAIFGALAGRLPPDIRLDGLEYRHEENGGVMQLLAVTRHETPWRNERVFTALMDALNGTPHLECEKSPDFAILRSENERLIRIDVTCRTIMAGRR